MKKQVVILFFAVFGFGICAYADNSNVNLTYDHVTDINLGHPSVIPTVSTDGDDVVIKCDSTLYNVDVVISDQYGNVMHQSTQTITPMESTIFVPDTGDGSEKTSIDLYYDDKHLKGYFED